MRDAALILLVDALVPGGTLPHGVIAPRASATPALDRARETLGQPEMAPLCSAIEALSTIDEASLGVLETAHRQALAKVCSSVLAAYYESSVVAEAFGWRASPPQPDGFTLSAFDADLLAPVRNRAPFWLE